MQDGDVLILGRWARKTCVRVPISVKRHGYLLNFFRTFGLSDDVVLVRFAASLTYGYLGFGHSAADNGITHSKTSESVLPVPPLPEQRHIAEILDTVDDAIQQTEALIAKLKLMRVRPLHDLLTRGIDDNGELRDPDTHPEQFGEFPLGADTEGVAIRHFNGELASQWRRLNPERRERIYRHAGDVHQATSRWLSET